MKTAAQLKQIRVSMCPRKVLEEPRKQLRRFNSLESKQARGQPWPGGKGEPKEQTLPEGRRRPEPKRGTRPTTGQPRRRHDKAARGHKKRREAGEGATLAGREGQTKRANAPRWQALA